MIAYSTLHVTSVKAHGRTDIHVGPDCEASTQEMSHRLPDLRGVELRQIDMSLFSKEPVIFSRPSAQFACIRTGVNARSLSK
ncbi:hypothetical protein HBH56_223800 [Parastagonospora nodorum]|uniref:Uncharacterized protein n=1 Tax=Phaeosphaeria nodorum (strain SN15 / ATCC MYA-4574 / FGSC 10173) TaxID=321614 RepID=A0A7U2I765_PHANO|nr:hypothetical protein HBH56_223800 [Parastagonospora nodorum]QRD04339.1 hypothetical protein JI435_420990 [Parastagonospora nodorum SN15]KAH3921876.1 hypothetical protein HBH54_231950 [Parastagonospora nodorum]KAH4125649.1 hypothetical protein HBH45_227910 [Parastagonospora nodorum]KAH4147379.1 hypothetical protein HBH44_226810 [Parastagonospora nodorum]